MSSTNFVVEPNYNLKMARSVKKLGKFDLKCAKIGENGRKITNFPIFLGENVLPGVSYFCRFPVFGLCLFMPPGGGGASSWNIDR